MKGILYKYIDKTTFDIKYAVGRPEDQTSELAKTSRVAVRLLDDDFKPVIDGNGKEMKRSKRESALTAVGYID